MKKIISTLVVLGAVSAIAAPAQARNTKVMLPLAAAMAENDAQSRLGDDVKFYFAGQTTPSVLQKLGSDKTSQKTNAFGKSDAKACNWAFLSAMLRLQKRAKELGANAVVNIVSNYDNVEFASATEFECHSGAIMAGVALKGDFVKVK
ncbi:excinuclease ATPase subunit [Massilia sp. RP-1-19]|uniref:Excinuclease ATPase subunit n=1 Tax=Massilia polaris TaxID=2728846 RepID=A0A848HII3_9BURK|nr:excinuclease ATPase subunit [Massilia polaris]NML60000.1 excinuclease ATPase subunit [Massilia polaris]